MGFFKTSKFFLVGQRRDKAVQDKHVPVGNSISYMLNILLSGCISRCGISIQIISWCWQTCFGLHDAAKSEFVKVCFYYFREILSRKHWYFLLAKTKKTQKQTIWILSIALHPHIAIPFFKGIIVVILLLESFILLCRYNLWTFSFMQCGYDCP